MSRRTLAIVGACAVVGLGSLAAVVLVGFGADEPPKRVLLYGDSLSVESAPWIQKRVKRADPSAVFASRAFPGTSPCDWFPRARSDSKSPTFAVIIEAFGNNQSRCQLSRAGNRPRSEGDRYWRDMRVDLRRLIHMFPSSTRIFLTVAPAAYNDDSAGRSHSRRMKITMTKAAAGFRNVEVIDAGTAVETRSGAYTRSLPCLKAEPRCTDMPKPGLNIVRAEDGIHFCPPVLKATVESLTHCPVYSSGAWRFAKAQAAPVVRLLTGDRPRPTTN